MTFITLIFSDEELRKPFTFPVNLLPTKNDWLLYVLTRTHHKSEISESHGTVVRFSKIFGTRPTVAHSRETLFSQSLRRQCGDVTKI